MLAILKKVNFTKGKPFIILNFHLSRNIFYESNYCLEIFSILSSSVYAKLAKKLGHYIINRAAVTPSMPILSTLLMIIFVEIFFEKCFVRIWVYTSYPIKETLKVFFKMAIF